MTPPAAGRALKHPRWRLKSSSGCSRAWIPLDFKSVPEKTMPLIPQPGAALVLLLCMLALHGDYTNSLYIQAGLHAQSMRRLQPVVAARGPFGLVSAPAPGAVQAPAAVVPLLGPSLAPISSLTDQPSTGPLNGTSAAIESANTVDANYCGFSSCGLFGPGSCQDYTSNNAASLGYLNYLQYETVSCGLANLQHQYRCCVEDCYVDDDCPASYYCKSGFTSGLSYCKLCASCNNTTVQKCQRDQSCLFLVPSPPPPPPSRPPPPLLLPRIPIFIPAPYNQSAALGAIAQSTSLSGKSSGC